MRVVGQAVGQGFDGMFQLAHAIMGACQHIGPARKAACKFLGPFQIGAAALEGHARRAQR